MLTVNINPASPHADNEMFTMLNFFSTVQDSANEQNTRQAKRLEYAVGYVGLLYPTTSEQTETGCIPCMQYTSLN